MDDRKSTETEIFTGSDIESGPLLAQEKEAESGEVVSSVSAQKPLSHPASSRKLLLWIAVNVLATIGIIFTNKLLLTTPILRRTQLLFAAYHFLLTHVTLRICSTRRIGLFPRVASPPLTSLLPIAIAMALNVVLPNLSLAHSSITFYQTARVLLTPCVAILNYILYARRISRAAALALIPVCLGVACVTYFDVHPTPHLAPSSAPIKQGLFTYNPLSSSSPPQHHPPLPHLLSRSFLPFTSTNSPSPPSTPHPTTRKGTSPLGALFALLGVLASAIYTLFISHYTSSLHLSPTQLLHRQSLLGGLLLLWAVPWIDSLPAFSSVTAAQWGLIAVSGGCAVAINLSQFAIVDGAGSVASTVVGHAKTVGVVGIGWAVGGCGSGWGPVGAGVAVGGMWVYSAVEGRERRRGRGS
ncbi:Hypothetical protein D9617_31g063600 [Elsinoe fawcettii]|nr:Hypothetical protein D9617_31g063600 [Elsinoe fawcettii]